MRGATIKPLFSLNAEDGAILARTNPNVMYFEVPMLKFLPIVVVAALGAGVPAGAATIATLYNTGVDGTGAALTGHVADSHWVLDGEATAYTGVTNGQFPNPPWVADTATSRWITPTTDAGNYDFDHSSDGIYTYTEVFSLTGYKAATASLSGIFSSDNTVDSITLNGTTINGSGGSYNAFQSFSSTPGSFVAGNNVLTFTVRNLANGSGSNPTGLNVEVTGNAAVVPEPASWALFVVGFGLVGTAARRRVRSVVA